MMTGFLNEKEFSRKTFVKGGGALVVTVAAASAAGKASAATGLTPFASARPAGLPARPDARSTHGSRSRRTTR